MNAPTDDDEDPAALFRSAIGPVRPMAERVAPPSRPKPAPRARMAERDEDDALTEFRRALDAATLTAADPLRFRRDHVPPRVLQRLARGQYAAQDEIDLHGLDLASAEAMLRQFLREAHTAGCGCVRIVHGKGLRSADGISPLKNLVDRMLRHRGDVLAFHSAPANAGGTGAVLVLLSPD